jgi:acetolactate synthase small subunit
MTDARPADQLLIITVHSRPGVLARIANAFYRRGLNIRTLTVDETDEPEQARIVVRLAARREEMERLVPAIANLVDVLDVALRAANAECSMLNAE